MQDRLSLGERGSQPVLDECERLAIPFVAWAPLAKGFYARAGGVVAEIAARRGATPAQVALAWLLHLSPVTVAIPGTSSVAHLEENAAALGLELTTDEIARLTAHRDRAYAAQRLERRGRIALGRVKRRRRG